MRHVVRLSLAVIVFVACQPVFGSSCADVFSAPSGPTWFRSFQKLFHLPVAGMNVRLGRKQEAAIAFEKAGRFSEAAQLHQEIGNYDQASALFERAGLDVSAAEAAERAFDYDRAAALYLRLAPTHDSVWTKKAERLQRLNQLGRLVTGSNERWQIKAAKAVQAANEGRFDEAKEWLRQIPRNEEFHKSLLKLHSQKSEAVMAYEALQLVFPLIYFRDPSSSATPPVRLDRRVECRGMCGALSIDVQNALAVIGIRVEKKTSRSGAHASVLWERQIIIDPTIRQFLDHPDLGGIFIGEPLDLARWVHGHPEAIAVSDFNTPEALLREMWNIEVH